MPLTSVVSQGHHKQTSQGAPFDWRGDVSERQLLCSPFLILPCQLTHPLPLPAESWRPCFSPLLGATLWHVTLGPSDTLGTGRLEALLTSKWTRWLFPSNYQCRMGWGASSQLPLLKCSQKTEEPPPFLR